jgi:hypothetical protein
MVCLIVKVGGGTESSTFRLLVVRMGFGPIDDDDLLVDVVEKEEEKEEEWLTEVEVLAVMSLLLLLLLLLLLMLSRPLVKAMTNSISTTVSEEEKGYRLDLTNCSTLSM